MLRVRTSAARNTGIEVRRKGKKGRRNFMPVKITIKTSALCTIKMKLSFFLLSSWFVSSRWQACSGLTFCWASALVAWVSVCQTVYISIDELRK